MNDESGQNDRELLGWLRLNLIEGVGPRLQDALLKQFGTVEAVFAATGRELRRVPGVGPRLAKAILEARDSDAAERELERCRRLGVRLLRRGQPDYPRLLERIADPPRLLYCRGSLLPRDELAVAIVGTRRCSLYGRQQAERLAGALARAGLTVVSGLARGIDAAAHRGALAAGGRTLAVLGTGLAKVYPPEHAELAERVAEQGALLSESRLDQEPLAGLFPQRNRLISGLSLGVIIVEATRNSGAIHTARHAMEQGREVMAVPGRVDSLTSEGCHDLIRDGATLVRNADDVLEALGPLPQPVQQTDDRLVHSPRELSLNEQERQVLNLIGHEPRSVDEVLQAAQLDTPRVLATLTVLEMRRLIRRLPGGLLVRSGH